MVLRADIRGAFRLHAHQYRVGKSLLQFTLIAITQADHKAHQLKPGVGGYYRGQGVGLLQRALTLRARDGAEGPPGS